MNTFLQKNKVFLLGLLSAIAVVLQQFVGTASPDLKTIAFAIGMAVLSYVANQWRGQGVTLTGIIGTLAAVFTQNYVPGGKINLTELILLFVLAFISAVAPPPKPASYEKNPTIEAAKDPGAGASENIGINTTSKN